jgi:phosphatidylinositol alpha-mannosyltransferase
VVKAGQNGLLVPSGDPQALAEALVRLISDGALRRKLGTAGQDMARRFDWPVIAEQVQDVYHAVLEKHG